MPNFAVGILYFSQIFFVNILDPSSCDEILSGPNISIPLLLKKSTIPSTSGFSGPTIIKSILFLIENSLIWLKLDKLISIFLAISEVPALPGKQYILLTLGDFLMDRHRACSLPPLPIIPTFI